MNSNRQLKFRAWDNTKLEWIDVRECSYTDLFEDEKYIVQQWTGLKDSKGVDVYEGDIVEFLHKGKTIFSKISYYSNVGMFAVVIEPNQEIDIETRKCLAEVCFFEVVGNIFENSELLKQ